MQADRAQANQGVGKVPNPIQVSLWDAASARKHRKEVTVKNGQQAKRIQRSSFSIKKTAPFPQILGVGG